MAKSKKNAVPAVLLLGAALQCATGFLQQQPLTRRQAHFQKHQQHYRHVPSHSLFTTKTTTTSSSSSLEGSPLLGAIGSPLGSVGVLAFVILFHEAGHYLAARTLGIKVEEFSVGIGPKLFGFQAFGNDFNLRGLPLGGYVRFPENYNITQVQEMEEELAMNAVMTENNDEKETSIMNGIMNALTFGRLERKRASEAEAKRLEEEAKRNWFSRLFGKSERQETKPQQQQVDIDYYDDPDLLQNRPWPQRALVLSGGVLFNILLAFLIFFGEINVGSGLPKPVFEQGAVVASLSRQGSPSKGILEPGDVIVKLNGSPISMSTSPNGAAAQRAIGDFIGKIRETPDGNSLNLSVLKANAEKEVDLSVQPKRLAGDGPQSIGVMLRPNFKNTVAIKTDSIPQAAKLAATSVAELTEETTNGLLAVFSQMASGKGAPAGQSVSGPIGLIRTGSSVVSTSDLTAVLMFMAAISVNLAVVNSLPLPALDGGQMLFVISEALTGRKVDQRVQEGITSVALVFLLLLTVSTTFGDVESIFRSSR